MEFALVRQKVHQSLSERSRETMIKVNVKKGTALLLCVSMLSGLSLSAVDSISVHAEQISEPSVTAFASKDDLENNFSPDSGNIGKLKFGMDLDEDDFEWYILGSDSGVGTKNTAIFAAIDMSECSDFQLPSNYEYNSDDEKFYYTGGRTIDGAKVIYDSPVPTRFYANHYGLSNARKILKDMVEDTRYFTSVERELINKTTVKTEDLLNKDDKDKPRFYKTSDELYLPYVNCDTDKQIYIGSDDSKKLDISKYCNTMRFIFLRKPGMDNGYGAYALNTEGKFLNFSFDYDHYSGVRPASNLNLTNVLFASAVPIKSKEDPEADSISADSAMILRLNGNDKDIGEVALNEAKDTISVKRGATEEEVTLVVQSAFTDDAAADSSSSKVDWYLRLKITEDVDITKDTIEALTKGDEDAEGVPVDLESAKIWLEIPAEDESSLAYAVEATKSSEPKECKHENLEFVPETKPTKTEPAYKEHWVCKDCGKLFIYVAGIRTEVTKENLIIPDTDKKTSGGGSSSGSSSNTSTGWIKDGNGWKFRNSDGTLAQGTTVTDSEGNKVEKVLWQKAGNGYYAFGSDGYLITGWIYDKLDDKWYYCDENMGKFYGWYYEAQDGYWYYLLPSTGEALTGWHTINGKDYCFAGAPSAPTYILDAGAGFWIYSNLNTYRPFGSMYANTVTPDNYQVDASGAWIH